MGEAVETYDVVVIGAGHAGCEAGLASARLGEKTVLFTISLDAVANMPCNPCIGGTAKGHLVCEIDALGGEMGKGADATFLQSRMLNKGKGPAVHSLRVQSDRTQYMGYMKHVLETTENLELKQDEIIDILVEEGKVKGVVTKIGAVYLGKSVIIASGTFLNGTIHVGDKSYLSGPDGIMAATKLSDKLKELNIPLRRFKTGTPARVNKRSIDFSQLEEQEGDEEIYPFSYSNEEEKLENKVVCHIAYTNDKTHHIIKSNVHKSAMYSGKIESSGPRYCPSIEDKIVRFSDKPRHQMFVEPCGLNTNEMYLQGMSSSLPLEVQIEFYRSIKGFEKIEIMRHAYAIEYDTLDPLALLPTLELKEIKGLYGAGQFNGTSGYEEAAAQGLIAGINAARKNQGKEPFILDRASSYIGTLIDDLVTKGVKDPYRMMTSRSEYRLLLRQDNGDKRLTPLGYEIGLISQERYQRYEEKQRKIEKEQNRVKKVMITPTKETNQYLESLKSSPLKSGATLEELIKRPELGYENLGKLDKNREKLPRAVWEQVEILIKYEGYIKRQISQVEEMRRLEGKKLDKDFQYEKLEGLRLEAKEKLKEIKPLNIGQASRISGVSPADISVLLIYLSQQERGKREEEKKNGLL